MTLTLEILNDWRRAEKDQPALVEPPGGKKTFLEELQAYLKQVQEEAGPHPAVWPEDCEAITAREVLEDIFRLRRDKLARAAALNTPQGDPSMPWPKQLLEFEHDCWFGLTDEYRMLDAVYRKVASTGTWSGKWGQDR